MAQNFDWFFGETPSTTKTNNQSSYGGFFDDQAVQPQEESGFFTNVAKAPIDRSLGLTDDLFEFINTVNQSAEDKLYQMGLRSAPNVQPDSAKNTAKPDAGDMPFINMLVGKEDLIETAREKIGYDLDRGVSWEEYKDDWTNPKKLASFIFEQGVKSVQIWLPRCLPYLLMLRQGLKK